MPVSPETLAAIGGGGLTADDYAGLTPEQIQAVAGQGQKDKQIMFGMASDMEQQKLAERKQSQDEMHQDRTFKLMQRQEARQEFETMHKGILDHMQLGLQKQRLGLEAMQTQAALKTHASEQEKLGLQIRELKRNEETLGKMRDKFLEVPGYTDDKGMPLKMSIAELQSLGALDKVIDAGLKKMYYTDAGKSKVIQLREYMASTAAEMGASKPAIEMIKLMGPEAVKGMNKQSLVALHMKNNPFWNTMSPDEQAKTIGRDLGLVDMLKVEVASTIADADEPYKPKPGDPSKKVTPTTLEDHMSIVED